MHPSQSHKGARTYRLLSADVSVETLLGRSVIDLGDDRFGADTFPTQPFSSPVLRDRSAPNSLTRLTRLGVGSLVLVDEAEAPLVELAPSTP